MTSNPYESPREGRRPSGWRRFWKRTCLGSLAVVVVASVADEVANAAFDGDSLTIVRALIALARLIGLTLMGVGGIGWIVSRREPVDLGQR